MKRSKKILIEVAFKHGLQVSDILCADRFSHFVEARRDAIAAMNRVGMTYGAIAKAMNRDRTTIYYYTRRDLRERKNEARARRRREARVQLNDEIFGLVQSYATQERIGIDCAANELLRSCLSTAA